MQTTDRPQTRLDLWRVDRVNGRAAAMLTERDDAWVNQKELQFPGNGDFILSSERDGHTHLYRYGADGKLRNAVTSGPWSVRGPQGFYGAPLDSTWRVYAQAPQNKTPSRTSGGRFYLIGRLSANR